MGISIYPEENESIMTGGLGINISAPDGLYLTNNAGTTFVSSQDKKHPFDIGERLRLCKNTVETLNKTIKVLESLKKAKFGNKVNTKFDTIIEDIEDCITEMENIEKIDVDCKYDKATDSFIIRFSNSAYKYAVDDLIERYKNDPELIDKDDKFDKLAAVIQLILFEEITDTD